jgi:hypothetical protein
VNRSRRRSLKIKRNSFLVWEISTTTTNQRCCCCCCRARRESAPKMKAGIV